MAVTFPHTWRRHGGSDHIWFTSGDGGGCDLNRLAEVRRGIVLAHYLKLNKSAASDGRKAFECGGYGKDIALPPRVPAVYDGRFLRRGQLPSAARPTTFYFAGNVPDRQLVDTTTDEALAREAYSEGVRQLVWKYHRSRAGYTVVERSPTCAEERWHSRRRPRPGLLCCTHACVQPQPKPPASTHCESGHVSFQLVAGTPKIGHARATAWRHSA